MNSAALVSTAPIAGIHTGRPGDGYVLRRLGRRDLPAIEAHFLALNPIDRGARFHAMLGDEAIGRYVRRIDFDRMILVGAVEPASGRLVAIAEAHLDDQSAPRVAEISVSVLAHRRRGGLGRRVVGEVLALVRELGVERAEFFFAPENRAIARLVHSLGGRVDTARGYASIETPLALAA